MASSHFVLFVGLALALAQTACGGGETGPTPLPTPTATPMLTPEPIPTATPTPAPSPTLSLQQIVWNERIESALAPSPCPTARQKELGISDYLGPLIDTHFHLAQLWDAPPRAEGGDGYEPGVMPALGKNITISQIACRLEQEGTSRVLAFFPVVADRPEQLRSLLEVVNRTVKKYPTRFVPFIMTPVMGEVSPTVDGNTLSEFLAVHPGLFQGYGEFVLYDFEDRRSAEDFPPDAPIFLDIYPIVREHNLLVYVHPGEGHQAALERVLAENPDLSFLVHGEEIEDAIGDIMERYPNIYYTVNELHGRQYLLRPGETKESFLAALEDYEPLIEKDLATWQDLIEAYPDRFMWGTDRGGTAGVWTYDPDVGQMLVEYSRAFIGRLDPDVQERFAYKNIEALLSSVGNSRR